MVRVRSGDFGVGGCEPDPSDWPADRGACYWHFLRYVAVFGLHFDYWIQQSRVTVDMLACD